MNRIIAIALALAGVIALSIPAAHALSTPMTEPVNIVVTCGTTATIINPGSAFSSRSMCIQNDSATAVHLGGSAVTGTTGLTISSGGKSDTWCGDMRRMYCAVAAGSVDVQVLAGIGGG